MRQFIICLLTIFFITPMRANDNCEHSQIKAFIEMPKKIRTGQRHVLIRLKVKNTSSDELLIRHPAYWGNAFPRIIHNGMDVGTIKVRVSSDVFRYLVRIKGHETLSFIFGFKLDEILNLDYCPPGKYEIYFELCPFSQLSSESIKSNVFTFYIK